MGGGVVGTDMGLGVLEACGGGERERSHKDPQAVGAAGGGFGVQGSLWGLIGLEEL